MNDNKTSLDVGSLHPVGSATSTWYKLTCYSYKVETVEVVRESEHCIWLKATQWGRERKTNKVSEWGHYYRTAQEALDTLRERATKRLAAVEAEAFELRRVLADMSPNDAHERPATQRHE